MQYYTLSMTSTGISNWLRLDTRGVSLHLYTVVVAMNEESAVVDVEFTIDPILDVNATPVVHDVLQDINITQGSIIEGPISGIRINVKTYNSGTIRLKVLQS